VEWVVEDGRKVIHVLIAWVHHPQTKEEVEKRKVPTLVAVVEEAMEYQQEEAPFRMEKMTLLMVEQQSY